MNQMNKWSNFKKNVQETIVNLIKYDYDNCKLSNIVRQFKFN